ncbi:MAG: 1-deoxy-D-xylulose-5-phosphate reductoisomerase [Desulfobacteraceae bacterium]|nr:1-deoxy-D-xylulose-5-phosphate reductoisomerase [Desulfobacteraceae bacterium]
MKKIAVLGSTGSIGLNTLDIVRRFPEKFEITSLSCKSSIDVLAGQIMEFRPEIASVLEKKDAMDLKSRLGGSISTKIVFGDEGYKEAVSLKNVDVVVSAIVGSAGLKPTIEAIYADKEIALANKESLVAAGDIVINEAKKRNLKILPVDSEHSAIFQCLEGNRKKEAAKIFLTASGGPFRKKDISEFKNITPEQALNHPTWSMGAKISIDSATLMNKGLEIIEACVLFDLPPEMIEVVVHPQSIVHSMVGYVDGSIIAQLGKPDMREAILYSLSWPERYETNFGFPDFSMLDLNFEKPDFEKFRSLSLAFESALVRKSMPCTMNAANEEAVYAFLRKEIRFDQIFEVVENVMNKHNVFSFSSIEDVFYADHQARSKALEYIANNH